MNLSRPGQSPFPAKALSPSPLLIALSSQPRCNPHQPHPMVPHTLPLTHTHPALSWSTDFRHWPLFLLSTPGKATTADSVQNYNTVGINPRTKACKNQPDYNNLKGFLVVVDTRVGMCKETVQAGRKTFFFVTTASCAVMCFSLSWFCTSAH